MIIIGLGNKARQGKNYCANYMQEELSDLESIKQFSFADELKKYCKEHHKELLSKWQLAHQTKQIPVEKEDEIYGYSAILQWYGTEISRKMNLNVWVDALAAAIAKTAPEVAIITDVRFPNEAEWVKKQGGYLVQVIRRNEDGSQYLDPGRDPNHSSETALDDYLGWNYIISCKDGNLESLKAKAIGVVYNILDDEIDKSFKEDGYDIFDDWIECDGVAECDLGTLPNRVGTATSELETKNASNDGGKLDS